MGPRSEGGWSSHSSQVSPGSGSGRGYATVAGGPYPDMASLVKSLSDKGLIKSEEVRRWWLGLYAVHEVVFMRTHCMCSHLGHRCSAPVVLGACEQSTLGRQHGLCSAGCAWAHGYAPPPWDTL